MRIAVATDERTGVAEALVAELTRRGHDVSLHGALLEGARADSAWAAADAATAAGARRWNDANVLALSQRLATEAVLGEILDAWFATVPSDDPGDLANLRHVTSLEGDAG